MPVNFQIGADLRAKRIVVAMSGGVEYSVVAALACRSGDVTIGVTLQLYDLGAKPVCIVFGICCFDTQ
jgi:tRNA-specific 2-thiouridylase